MRLDRLLPALLLSLLLGGCLSGGAENQQYPDRSGNGDTDKTPYSGPGPQTADVQAFRINLWERLRSTAGCANCHDAGGEQPRFARGDDVNMAYGAANTVVDLDAPGDSRMVAKVGGGHHCWRGSDAVCAADIASWIEAWAGGSDGGGTLIELVPPPMKDPGTSKTFPALNESRFTTTVHPVLTQYCSDCHAEDAATAQSPFFAGDDPAAAYDSAKLRINLDAPADSRLVVRLREEFHNCWSDCEADADEMQAAIEDFADDIEPTEVNSSLVTSKALTLGDGVVAAGGNRVDTNVIAKWEFKTGTGATAYDTSGVAPALDLTFSGGGVTWVGGWGIEIREGKAQGSTRASEKVTNLIRATGEYSLEAWVVPANVTQEGPARIVTYSGSDDARNFMLGQSMYSYDFLNRADTTDANGEPTLATANAAELLQATQQHVVVTYDPANGRRIYVNGEFTGDLDPSPGGNLDAWEDNFAFALGSEVSGDHQWQGKLRLVAVHNRALTPEQIRQNFIAGVGEKFFLLFALGDLTDVPDDYVVFEVSQFDSYSYLFNEPRFISLDSDASPAGIPIEGMRIGINGKEASVGQTYSNLDVQVGIDYAAGTGQLLSPLGAVIALEKGPEGDEFFLTFERLGSHTNVVVEADPPASPTPADAAPSPEIGLRTFDEINASMAELTTVPTTNAQVRDTYRTIKQQLPTVENVEGFLSAHQMAVAQLAIEYCNVLVENPGLRGSYFPGFDFTAGAGSAFDTVNERRLITDPLLDRMLTAGLDSQPPRAAVEAELDSLMTGLSNCGGSCPAGRTAAIVTSTCAATLGSAAVLLQ